VSRVAAVGRRGSAPPMDSPVVATANAERYAGADTRKRVSRTIPTSRSRRMRTARSSARGQRATPATSPQGVPSSADGRRRERRPTSSLSAWKSAGERRTSSLSPAGRSPLSESRARPENQNQRFPGDGAREPPPTRLSLLAQWTNPDTIGADEQFWRGVLDPGDRVLNQALAGQPR
jgi:hypothetical protein